jgi:hypothetical protein
MTQALARVLRPARNCELFEWLRTLYPARVRVRDGELTALKLRARRGYCDGGVSVMISA